MALINGIWLDDIFAQETPTGTVDGVNTDFTISATPHSDTGIVVFLNGLPQILGVHWNLNMSTPTIIEFVTAPAPGQSVYVWYVKGRA